MEVDVDTQKQLLKDMLTYLGRDKFSIQYSKDYEQVTLTYLRDKGILLKKIRKWDFNGKTKEQGEKEKAMGGHNGNLMFNSVKKEMLKVVEKKVLKNAIRNELTDCGIDYELIED